MNGFNSSKAFQTLLMSKPTVDLLVNQFDADLPWRTNIVGVEWFEPYVLPDGTSVVLMPSEHMLGAAQVSVTLPSGRRIGYSGDFSWPMNSPIAAEQLVLDCTYGSRNSVRYYSQGDADDSLLQLVCDSLKSGPVFLKCHRGTVERALSVLEGDVDAPVVTNRMTIADIKVHRANGFAIGPVIDIESPEGRLVCQSSRYIRIYGRGDPQKLEIPPNANNIVLSAMMVPGDQGPIVTYGPRSYRIALSNHADFTGTLEYVAATGASFVLVDNSRHGNAIELADAIRTDLGIAAAASEVVTDFRWGV
ncbi:hypothetical protein [Mycobacterium sp. MFM001]|uniref:hypothetical protein n=1 Tax=Mycobacterium sp. MFM001 TaxID=2049453 RepID=UPI001158C7E4|nr:hypothetical protein [Mycobacterium sp. MFM001]